MKRAHHIKRSNQVFFQSTRPITKPAEPHHTLPAEPRPIAYSGLWHAVIYPNPTHALTIITKRIPAWKRAHLEG